MIAERDGQLFVSGVLNQQTAASLLAAGESLVAQADRVVNLSGASAVDSSAVAVLLGWMRAARAAGRTLSIVEAPTAFVSLVSLYGVTPILFPETLQNGSDTRAQH